MKKVVTHTIQQTHDLAQQCIAHNTHRVMTLHGDLGSGKTTFAQGILHACGAEGPYTSPTFTIVKEYDIDAYGYTAVYHIDAYRITSADVVELGWHDMMKNTKALVIIEWPENIADVLPDEKQEITCAWVSASERAYTF